MTAITLSNINKRFGEKVLFRDYSLHIEAGEFVAIKGESGAGKTTLLNIIGLLERPDSGSVTLCGARNPSFSSRAAAQAVLPVSELRAGGHRHRGSQHEARHPVR